MIPFFGAQLPAIATASIAGIVLNLLLSIGGNYRAGHYIAHRAGTPAAKRMLTLAVTANLLLLGYYKYADFFIASANAVLATDWPLLGIILPIGISFFTFTQIAFLVDAYVGKVTEYRFIHYLLFVTYFPHLIAGPVLHHKEMMPQFDKDANYHPHAANFAIGLTIFAIGLAKKVLIADNLAAYAAPVFAPQADAPSLFIAWGGVLAYTFQIYFDFSGYSDMAIGLSRLFGVHLPLNFASPYKATNIIEFWRRWHMTLSRFLRDYLYIPLGGSRRGPLRRQINLMLTMLIGGLWHGAAWNFIIWGLYFAVLIILEKLVLSRFWEKVPRVIQHIYTMFFVMIGWIIFSADDLVGVTAGQYLSGLFGFGKLPLWDSQAIFYLLQYAVIFILAAYFSTPHFKKVLSRIETTNSKILWSVISAGYLIVFVASIAFIVNGSYKPFLYFRF